MVQVDLLAHLLGFSGLAGLNPYGTAVAFGLLLRAGLIADPALTGPAFQVFATPELVAITAILFTVNLLADKLPVMDHAWDLLHTALRPLAGAYVGFTLAGAVSPEAVAGWLQLAYAVTGVTVAAGVHAAKAGTRQIATVMTAGILNPLLSLAEHSVVVTGTALVAFSPMVAVVVLATALGLAYIAVRGLAPGHVHREARPLRARRRG